MPAYRFYKKEPFESAQELTLDGEEFHHLKNVMRHKEGDHIEVINGLGGLAFAEIKEIKRQSATVLVSEVQSFEKSYNIILLQAMPKINKLELIVEKGTELGMGELHLFKGEKSMQKFTEEKIFRLEQKAISALKQSGRFYLPEIKLISPISSWEISSGSAYYGDLSFGAPPLYEVLPTHIDLNTFSFCCGPESGFSQNEISFLKGKNFKGVGLHTNILRAETAPLVFLSLIHHHLLIHGDGSVVN